MKKKSEAEKLIEYAKLMQDPYWRLNHLYKIKTKKGGLVTFKENRVQAILNRDRTGRDDILKSRQMGISTNELLYKFDKAIHTPHTTYCILAHERDALEKLFQIIRRAYDNMHPFAKPLLDRGGGSKHEMYFPQLDSKIYVDLESRGDTINLLHASELAFMKNLDRFKATAEAVPLDGEISRETTPDGMNHFYDLWVDEETTYKKFFFPWYFQDEYALFDNPIPKEKWTDEELEFVKNALENYKVEITPAQIAFRRMKIKDTKKMFFQEYPEDDISCFLTTGSSYFDLMEVKKRFMYVEEPLRVVDCISIFKEPDPKKTYVIGADTCEGDGTDFNIGEVWCIEDFEQVAELRSKIKPSDFGKQLYDLGEMYKYNKNGSWTFPLLGVERNNHGHAVLQTLDEDLEYPNLYFERGRAKDAKMKRGWNSTSISRPIMLSALQTVVDEDIRAINSKLSLKEFMSFINENGKPQAASGKNDDAVIANGIAIQMIIEDSNGFEFIKIGADGVVGENNIDREKVLKYL